jgi:8-hydroxy-5-deazaflavin:NADPH oxidoreductase
VTTIGILGAGKLGTVLARLAVAAGHRTLIAASGEPDEIALLVDVMAPGAIPAHAVDLTRDADIVILALPLSRLHTIKPEPLDGKIVVDAMNYWPAVDGVILEFENGAPSSLAVAAVLPGARIVRALSHLGYHQLDEDARPVAAGDRHAMAIAGDDLDALDHVAALVDDLGFDPVIAGGLSASACFGPGTAAFGTSVPRHELITLLRREGCSQRPSEEEPSATTASR